MSKRISRVLSFALALVLLFTSLCFATVSIVSPVANGVVSGDSLLVSVQVSDQRTIRVTVFEEKEKNAKDEFIQANIGTIKTEDLETIESAYKQAVTDAEKEKATVKKVAVKEENEEKESAETTTPTGFQYVAKLGKINRRFTDLQYTTESAVFKNEKAGVGFYTRQLSDVKPGLYRIQVETIDVNGDVLDVTNSFTIVKEKVAIEKKEASTSAANTSGAVQFITKLLNSIFK